MNAQRVNLLIVEDEKSQREMLEGFLRQQGFSVSSVDGGEKALDEARHGHFDLVLLDYKMPGMDGLQTLGEMKRINPELAVVMMTAYGTVETAVQAMKEGAADYLTKPIDLEELLLLIEKVSERMLLQRENKELKERLRERYRFDQIVYASGRMEEVMNLTGRVAQSEATVLIRGESGTGKELIANAIHYSSPRAGKPFIKVNCTALPENLLESELFGHERGAFTGAIQRRIGRCEQAHTGSIFLDEIGDLPSSLQATSRDLEGGLQRGTFREDLYYRLNVIAIVLPPLRERKEDIPLLIDHFLEKYSQKNRRPIPGVSKEARDFLLQYAYPGNVRELENIIERSVVVCRGDIITTRDLPFQVRERLEEAHLGVEGDDQSLGAMLSQMERDLIVRALDEHGGVQTKAAKSLGISERVLRYKMKKYGLSP
jgi:two-component system NtrC family response regulator